MKNQFIALCNRLQKNPHAQFILLLICIGFFLRIYDLDKNSLWGDEGISSLASKGILENGRPALPSGNEYYRSLPFHYLTAFSFAIFGVNDSSARYVGVLFGVLIIPVMYKFGKEIGGRNTGVLAAVLVTFSFWNIWQSRQARFYQQFQFFTILSMYFFYKGFVNDNKKYKYLTFPALVLCIYTHDLSVLLIPAFFLYLLIEKKRKKKILRNKFLWVGTATVSLAFLSQYLLMHSSGLAKIITKGQINGDNVNKTSPIGFSIFNFLHYLEIFIYPSLLLGLIFAILALIIYLYTKDKKLLYLNFMFWIPFLITTFCIKWNNPRYIFFLWPMLLLIISYLTIVYLIPRFKKNYEEAGKKFIVIVFIILLISHIGVLLIDNDTYYYNSRADFRSAANFVKENKHEGDKIIAIDSSLTYYYLGQCDYYMRQNRYTGSVYEKEGKYYDKHTSADLVDNLTELKEVLQKEKRIWFVVGDKYSDRLKEDIKSYVETEMELVYIASDKKAKVFFFENLEN